MRPSSAEPGVVLVTGARRGIGRAVAQRFLDEGWQVALNDVDGDGLGATFESLIGDGPLISAHQADVGDREQVDRMVEEVHEEHGRLDVLVNNAAAIQFSPFAEYATSDFELAMRTNLLGTFHCSQSVARWWIAAGSPGSIINISSVSAHQARPGHAAYGASKAGLEMLSKVAAMELAPHGIRVNCVAPGGPIMTEYVQDFAERPGFEERVSGAVPLGRTGDPDEVAGVVFFLATKDASYMTGAVVVVDGGVTLGRP
ncbi:MAG: SDR family NAD(P)-dependent oxidoreductase [Acidimicrobiia bacterium]